jgi:hypothetical protein
MVTTLNDLPPAIIRRFEKNWGKGGMPQVFVLTRVDEQGRKNDGWRVPAQSATPEQLEEITASNVREAEANLTLYRQRPRRKLAEKITLQIAHAVIARVRLNQLQGRDLNDGLPFDASFTPRHLLN